jgi:subtilase family serine protease
MIRKIRTSLFTIAALVPAINIVQAASPSPATAHVRDVVASGQAKSVGRLPATQPMRLVLVLPHRNQAALESLLKDLYDPSSPSYHQFLTVDEFTSRFGPSQEDYDAVTSFAQSHGLTVVGTARNRMNVDVAGPVANVEEALHVNMGLYQHPTENRVFYSADREPTPDLPVALWHISGLDNYSIPQPALVHRSPNAIPNATTGSCPSASFCGSDMRAAYYGGSLTGTGQSLGLLEYAGTDLADLATYYKNAGQTNNVPITLLSTDGTSTSCLASKNCDDTEQTIDMSQALGMAPGLSSLVMYVGSVDTAIFNAMATASPLNAQLSSSWTWTPADPSTDNPFFEEFAAQGQNLFQASGDSAAWRATSEIWPADSIYVTSVGGTDLETSGAGGPWSSETAWSNGGGGISPDKFPIPSWQTAAAAGCSKCSKTLRNGPDVSANANYTFYVCADQTTCTANDYGGTSFAAPMWAAYLALTNELRVSNGGTTLGFINPTLYTIGLSSSYTTDFHDITGGSNGYAATAGYDLATGWGSPNGSGLLNALAGSSTAPGFSLSASPTSVSVAPGGSGTSTITSAVTGGFDSAVTLTASGTPTGVTVGFNPSSITGNGTSTMTMNVASSTVPGTYSITVTGTSGSILETTSVSLTVTGTTGNFTISVSPTTITVARGSSGTATITTTVSGGFNAAIALSAAAAGVSFSPTSIPAPGAGKSTVTVKVSTTAALGDHTLTITGTGGGLTHTTTLTVDIIQ